MKLRPGCTWPLMLAVSQRSRRFSQLELCPMLHERRQKVQPDRRRRCDGTACGVRGNVNERGCCGDDGQADGEVEPSKAGHVAVVRALLDAGASVDARKSGERETALHTSAKIGSVEEVRALLAAGAAIGVTGQNACTPIGEAAAAGHSDVVQLLAEALVTEQPPVAVQLWLGGKGGVEPKPDAGDEGGLFGTPAGEDPFLSLIHI